MDTDITLDNLHKKYLEDFKKHDPLLASLKSYPLQYHSPLLDRLPTVQPGIYTLIGGGLLGKTTLLKQWIAKLLATGIHQDTITFFPGKTIKNSEVFIQLLQSLFSNKNTVTQYIIVDDINDIAHWDQVIQWMMMQTWFNSIVIVLSGSHATIPLQLKNVYSELKDENNIHLYPLSFRETVLLKFPSASLDSIDLLNEFNFYLLHGGYLPAINDVVMQRKVSHQTVTLYSDWLIKEFLLQGKHKNFICEILAFVVEHYLQPVSLNNLTKACTIEHPKTIGNYLELLSQMDTIVIQPALLEKVLLPAPKKPRKIIFADPFIFHAIHAFTQGYLLRTATLKEDIHLTGITNNPDLYTNLVKTCIISQFQRFYPIYYIKDEGEIDLAYVYDRQFWPVIISWVNPLHSKDIKQIVKYANGRILTRGDQTNLIEHIRTESLLQVLWELGGER